MGLIHGYLPQKTEERHVVDLITGFKYKTKGGDKPDVSLFDNLLFDPFGYEGIEEYNGYYVAKNVLRKEMQLKEVRRPGDFDIIFIPYNSHKLFYDRTAVFEVKIARPNFGKPNKDPNSLGKTQTIGLIEDGFPLVGLIHVCMPDPLTEDQTTWINVCTEPINIDWQPGNSPETRNEIQYEPQPLDWLPTHAIHNQMRRIISAGFPKYVGINSFALTLNQNGKISVHISKEYTGYTSGYFNPFKDDNTIKCIENHFLKFGEERYTKLEIWDLEINL